ncbi:MAG: tetratricopeptide repeat protein [Streptosporangiaceae bacterium]|nr:tetratricopeptide repeat protein [Streptosporangiaceae bacterium]
MIDDPDKQATDTFVADAATVKTSAELAILLRALRRRHARRRHDRELTYQAMASRTGCSQTAIAEYFTARTIPPTDRFDALIRLLGASRAEQGALATARDRVDEHRRNGHQRASGEGGPPPPPVARPEHDGHPWPEGNGGQGGPGVPRQLPTALRHFSGRDGELAELDCLLDRAPDTGAVLVTAISGTAGIGKTALAVYWAHRVADRFPDGQLYVNLRGFDASAAMMEPAEAVRRFLDALGVPPERIPADLDAQAALYRSHMAGRRMLLVLDNARDSAQVRPLLPGTSGCLVLVTSRSQLTSLIAADSAHPLTLNLLTGEEARRLLGRRLGAGRVAAEPAAVTEIITCCARLPLALALLAARAAVRPTAALRLLADELCDTQQRWQTLADDDPSSDVRTVMSWSYQALTPAAARLFRLLGLHPGQDTDTLAAASLAGLDPDVARPLLAELSQASLLAEHIPGRYTFHDLLRAYATHLTHTIDPHQQRRAATIRVLDHYLHSAYAGALLLAQPHNPLALEPPQPGVAPVQHTGYEQARRWFTAEYRVILVAISHAATAGFDTHAWQLTWSVWPFLDRQGHWHEFAAAARAAVAAADRLADPAVQAWARRTLGRACTRLGRFDDADLQLQNALSLYDQSADQAGQADTHDYLSILWWRRNRLARALEHAQQCLNLSRATGHRGRLARALNGIGWIQALLGDPHSALTSCKQALAIHQELGDVHGQAQTWDSLGYTHRRLGHHLQAIACFRNALTMAQYLGDRYQEADTLVRMGDTHLAVGDQHAAHDAWRRALAILKALNHPDAEQVIAKLSTA